MKDTLSDFRHHLKSENHSDKLRLCKSEPGVTVKREPKDQDQAAGAAAASDHSDEEDGESGAESEEETPRSVFQITERGLYCEKCDYTTSDFDKMMVEHNMRFHPTELFAMSCKICNYSNTAVKDVLFHITSKKHEDLMRNKFFNYTPITTSLTYRITTKDKILCVLCKTAQKVERLSSHVQRKHELTGDIKVHCALCMVLIDLDQVREHRQLAGHRYLVQVKSEPEDTVSSPPVKKPRMEAGQGDHASTVSAAATPALLQPKIEKVDFGSKGSLEEPIELDSDSDTDNAAVENSRQTEPPAETEATIPPPTNPHLTEDDLREMLEEFKSRKSISVCPCGFIYQDAPAHRIHTACHMVKNGVITCSSCRTNFDSPVVFLRHLHELHKSKRRVTTPVCDCRCLQNSGAGVP